jgi:hypothetical protein
MLSPVRSIKVSIDALVPPRKTNVLPGTTIQQLLKIDEKIKLPVKEHRIQATSGKRAVPSGCNFWQIEFGKSPSILAKISSGGQGSSSEISPNSLIYSDDS